jgi:Ser/Thr protein kinase RdoA (MazF antagonist)
MVEIDTAAVAALERFGIRSRRLRPLARDVRSVVAEDGQKYALRLRPIADRVFGDIPVELAWMAALREETEVEAPEVVPGLDGRPVQEVDGHDCVLFRWIPGVELAQRLTPANVRKLGVLSARLHQHAATFRPPAELPVRTLDRLVRGAEQLVMFDRDHGALLPPARKGVFQAVADRYATAVAAIYADPTGRRVIHSDLHHENVKVHQGRLRPLDFYEVI